MNKGKRFSPPISIIVVLPFIMVEPAFASSSGNEQTQSNCIKESEIFFNTGSAVIQNKWRSLLDNIERYLEAHPDKTLLIEGNADERGAREYSMSIGNQRAAEVYRILKLMGVHANQMSFTSYGAEKPLALEHNDMAWARNRRVDLFVCNK